MEFKIKPNRILESSFVILYLIDLGITLWGINNGFIEGNPIGKYFLDKSVFTYIILRFIILIVCRFVFYHTINVKSLIIKKLILFFRWFLPLIYLLVLFWNLSVIL